MEIKIGSILDYSVEGKDKEVDFKRVKNETINNIIKASKSSKIPLQFLSQLVSPNSVY